jgi:glycosyltransferase involved in cell wall biosynthesis
MPSITAHMVVKNEDCWVWYAIQSVLPYVDTLLITDTGSTDRTIELIKSIKSPKIIFKSSKANTPEDVTKVRNQQIADTKTEWIWIVDGDEIYPESLCKEIVGSLAGQVGLVVRRYDLLGDLHHYQSEAVGTYEMYGQKGHFSLRLLNLKAIQGLVYKGDYPYEGFYDKQGKSLLDYEKNRFAFTNGKYFHAGYLQRSTQGANLIDMFNRHKYKIEKGYAIDTTFPEVVHQKHPFGILPLAKRGYKYEIMASLITPFKALKRRFTQ